MIMATLSSSSPSPRWLFPKYYIIALASLALIWRTTSAWTTTTTMSTTTTRTKTSSSSSSKLPTITRNDDEEESYHQRHEKNININRRDYLSNIMMATTTTAGAATSLILKPVQPSDAILPGGSSSDSLATKLSKRDPNVLTNPIFNIPPSIQIYPEFMRGQWDVKQKFGGYIFPSTKITRQRLMSNSQIPGFQKCSIAALSDVGISNERDVTYKINIDPITGIEDRQTTLTTQINSNLGYDAISEIIYNGKQNPNRLSIIFKEYRTTNAERIELFCNSRESEKFETDDEDDVFVCSEYIRQVTFGTGSEVGIPRQVVGNYAHFYTWKRKRKSSEEDSNNSNIIMTGNLLTAAYIDPQDSMYFDEPSKPVAVYSHILTATQRKV